MLKPEHKQVLQVEMAFADDDIKQKEADTLLTQPAVSTIMGEKVTETVEVEEEGKSEKYPWPLLVRTVLLLNAFLALGINDAMGGPTLLDLRYGTWLCPLFQSSFAGTLLGPQ